ncbi:MAG TPA: AAA family ATPase, partial [Nitrososphaeraceae archaeon]|nr:AAA family ATPase [Nitrososphaeraceae archaeon]
TAGFHYYFISDFLNKITIINSVRNSLKRVPVKHTTERNIRGTNYNGDSLANLVHIYHSNEENKFDKITEYCYKIFPDLESINSEILKDNSIAIMMRKKGNDRKIELEFSGSGLDQLLILIWTIATAESDTIWLIDEPELHLHPEAENYLYNFFRDQVSTRKQIIVATHSMIFVHKNELKQISVFHNEGHSIVVNMGSIIQDDALDTIVSDLEIFKQKIYSALGYDPSFSFESNKILMVEGYTDYRVIPILSKKCKKRIDPKEIKIIPIGDRNRLVKNSSIIASLFPDKKVMMIVDNDKKDRDSTLQSILSSKEEKIKTLRIKDNLHKENILFYDDNIYSIESFLLDPIAISNAVGKPEKSEEIKKLIEAGLNNSEKPKDILKHIWDRMEFGEYSEVDDGIKIAQETFFEHLINMKFNLIVDKILSDS